MDQNAFRNLLSTQAVKPGTGRSAGVLGTHAAKRGAGKSKNSTYKLTKTDDKKTDGEDAGSALDLAPRKAAGKKGGKGRDNGDAYQDRSESRRTGNDDDSNEFKAAEKLAEDFEKRARAEGQDEETIAEQRKYLGGDATHSILVKGLDLALLAQRKAEIEATEGKKAEDELDAILEGEHSGEPNQERGSDRVSTGKKRTREEIVQQLKRQRTGASGSEAAAPQETLGSKFKSIAQKKREAEEAQALAQGKKKLKKKKKVAPSTPANAEKKSPAQSTSTTAPAGSAKREVPEASKLQAETIQESDRPKNGPIPGVTPLPDDEEDDIFGGVGEYVGAVDSNSESDVGEVERKPSPKPERARSRSRSVDDKYDNRRRSPRGYERSRSRDRYTGRDRYDERDRYDGRDRYGNYSRDEQPRPRSRSRDYDRDYRCDRSRYEEPYDSRGERNDRRRSRSRERSYRDDRRDDYRREYKRSRSRSPYRERALRSPSPRRSAPPRSPAAKANPTRSPSRSPTPVNIEALRALSQSPEFSDEEDPYSGPVRPGQSLRALGFGSSDVPSAKELLEMDAIANKADEKRANKAKWRRAQGLAAQEGAGNDEDDGGGNKNRLGQELTEQQKMRRDQQRLEAYMAKKEKAAQ